MRKDCACLNCVLACVRCPGRLVPDDIAPIAQHLGVSEPELLTKYLVNAGTMMTPALAPRLTPDGCVFLKDQRCSIHAVKPYECREAMHDLTPVEVEHIDEVLRQQWRDHLKATREPQRS